MIKCLLIGLLIGGLIGFFINEASSGQPPNGGHHDQVEDAFFKSIDSKFDMVTAYTQWVLYVASAHAVHCIMQSVIIPMHSLHCMIITMQCIA